MTRETKKTILRRVLGELSPTEREALHRFYALGQRNDEISAALGLGERQLNSLKLRVKARFVLLWETEAQQHHGSIESPRA